MIFLSSRAMFRPYCISFLYFLAKLWLSKTLHMFPLSLLSWALFLFNWGYLASYVVFQLNCALMNKSKFYLMNLSLTSNQRIHWSAKIIIFKETISSSHILGILVNKFYLNCRYSKVYFLVKRHLNVLSDLCEFFNCCFC